MDSITRNKVKMIIHGADEEKARKAFELEFGRKLLRENPDVARDILDYIYQEFVQAKSSLANEFNAQPENANYASAGHLMSVIERSIELLRFKALSEIYNYVFSAISSEMDDDGNIRETKNNKDEEDIYI